MMWEEKVQYAAFCKAQNHTEEVISEEVRQKYGIVLPQDYENARGLIKLAVAKKTIEGSCFCRLPFGHTAEAEAFGGKIRYNGEMPPYISSYCCHLLEEILKLPEADFTKGRLHEILNACKQLKEEGFSVLLEISGPFTILNGLLSTEVLLRAIRKEPVLFAQAWKKMSIFLLTYLEKILECQVDLISYADPLTGADILGPKRAADVARTLVYPFLKQAEAQVKERALILLCPKISAALVEAEVAVFRERNLKQIASYGEACLHSVGKIQFVGEMCSKREQQLLNNGTIKELKLL